MVVGSGGPWWGAEAPITWAASGAAVPEYQCRQAAVSRDQGTCSTAHPYAVVAAGTGMSCRQCAWRHRCQGSACSRNAPTNRRNTEQTFTHSRAATQRRAKAATS